jgi:NADP-dependent 3-hydroxy acid dehydrogenase YdfG
MSNITNKVVVITGASSGIGESTAKLLAEQGAKVVLGARRLNRINAVVQVISATGGKAIGFACDVTKRAEVEATRKNLREFMKMAIPASVIARAIAYAIEQPADVEIDEVVVRPTAQGF